MPKRSELLAMGIKGQPQIPFSWRRAEKLGLGKEHPRELLLMVPGRRNQSAASWAGVQHEVSSLASARLHLATGYRQQRVDHKLAEGLKELDLKELRH